MTNTTETGPTVLQTSVPSHHDFSDLVACAAKGNLQGLESLERLVMRHPDFGEKLLDYVRRRERKLITGGTTTREVIERFRGLFALDGDGSFEAFLIHHVTVSCLDLIRHELTAGATGSYEAVRRYPRVLEKTAACRNRWMNALSNHRLKKSFGAIEEWRPI